MYTLKYIDDTLNNNYINDEKDIDWFEELPKYDINDDYPILLFNLTKYKNEYNLNNNFYRVQSNRLSNLLVLYTNSLFIFHITI